MGRGIIVLDWNGLWHYCSRLEWALDWGWICDIFDLEGDGCGIIVSTYQLNFHQHWTFIGSKYYFLLLGLCEGLCYDNCPL